MVKFLSDILTGKDNLTYDAARVVGVAGGAAYVVFWCVQVIVAHRFAPSDAEAYGKGLSMVLLAMGGLMRDQTLDRARPGAGGSTRGRRSEVSWEAVATFSLVAVTFIGLNAAVLRWMFDRHQEAMARDGARWDRVEHQMFEVRATLPLEYVRREDWIRFCGTFDAKLDAMRDEMREEIGSVKEKLYV